MDETRHQRGEQIARIDSVAAFQASLPVASSVSAPGLEPNDSEVHVFVRIEDDHGRTGIGEAVVRPDRTPSAQEMIGLLEDNYGPAVVGLSPLERITVVRAAEDADPEHPTIRAALDLALHDLVGKILDTPALVLLGGSCQRKLPLVGTLVGADIGDLTAQAIELMEKGHDTLKLSVGEEPDRDLEIVAKLRESIGPEVRLRVAANEQYSLVTATRVLKKMEEYGLELVEQPLPRSNLEGLAELCSLLDTPVLTTASIHSPSDAIEFIGKGATDILGINSVDAGGLLNAMRIAGMAHAASLPCCVIGVPFGPIGTAADLQLASVINHHGFAIEIPGPLRFDESVFRDPILDIGSASEGFLIVPDQPGLI